MNGATVLTSGACEASIPTRSGDGRHEDRWDAPRREAVPKRTNPRTSICRWLLVQSRMKARRDKHTVAPPLSGGCFDEDICGESILAMLCQRLLLAEAGKTGRSGVVGR